MNAERSLARLVRFYEGLTPATLAQQLAGIYAADAYFKDPFNEVRGLAPIAAIFTHMFDQLEAPRFVVTGHVSQGAQAFLTWEFQFKLKRFSTAPQCIRGATHIVFDVEGKVSRHRDYWDAAEELYEKLPLVGTLMRWLKRLVSR
ncbi:MAG: nuclear transport factor 2 family protein [Pseudomonadota bacterium]